MNPRSSRAARYWLLKSEPETFSFDDLLRAPKRTTAWSGVRNFQARNLLRDEMARGDGVLFYHSSAVPSGVAGVARVASAGYPDPTQFDARDPGHDPKSTRASPRWFALDVRAERPLARFVALAELRAEPRLEGMLLLQRGSRLSVQPVRAAEWRVVLALGGLDARDLEP